MRTTLDIADDVLFAAKELARQNKSTLGHVISDLARRAFSESAKAALPGAVHPGAAPQVAQQLAAYGIHPLAPRGTIVSNELIERLRDEEGV